MTFLGRAKEMVVSDDSNIIITHNLQVLLTFIV